MNFAKHSELEGAHAFLSASKYHWINYDINKLEETFLNWRAAQVGTELHEYAAMSIRLGQKLPSENKTLNMYVNDAIGFKMEPEVVLFYSENCFGTADTICFRNNTLRIHDLKTGKIPAHIEQLEVYAALFCLEYKYKPADIKIHLRIYQNDEVLCHDPQTDEIVPIMDKIKAFDKRIRKMKMEY